MHYDQNFDTSNTKPLIYQFTGVFRVITLLLYPF